MGESDAIPMKGDPRNADENAMGDPFGSPVELLKIVLRRLRITYATSNS
jgi:hypothetical protein